MFRFIHAADIHLDSPLRGLDQDETAPKERIRNASRVALKNLVDFALEQRVNFIVIGGDVYDGDWVDYATGHFFLEQMRRLAPIPVFLIHGNHDATNKMTKSLPMPNHLHVFSSKMAETKKLEEFQVAIHGRSFGSSEIRENLVRDYPAPVPGYFNIGLLHSSLVNMEDHDCYAPCSSEQLVNHGYDYWALGHIHKRQIIRESDPTIVFSGNLQGRHVRERGPKGAYLIGVDDSQPITMEFLAFDDVRWAVIEHKAHATCDGATIIAAAASQARTCQADGRLLILRVRLQGECLAHDELIADRASFVHQLRALLKDELGEDVWLEDLHVETCPPRVDLAEDGVDDSRNEVNQVLSEIRLDSNWFAVVVDEFVEIRDKFPSELFRGPEAIRLDDADWLAEMLNRVRPILFHVPGGSL